MGKEVKERLTFYDFLEIGGAPLSTAMLSVRGPIYILDPKAQELTPAILNFMKRKKFNELFDFF